MNGQERGYIPSLDGWRTIAILGVIVAHGCEAMFTPGSTAYSLTRQGALGVDIFFGISGYLITTRLLEQEKVDLKRFYIRRVFRIFPPYFTYLFCVGLLALVGVLEIGRWDYLSCVLFVRNYLSPSEAGSWWTAHFWSLAVEEHFYILWPTLLALVGIQRAPRVVLALALALATWRSLEFRARFLDRILPGVNFFERSDVRLDALLWGCLAALVIRARPDYGRRIATTPFLLVFGGLFAACVWNSPPQRLLFQAIVIPAMLVATSSANTSATRVLELGPVRWVGRLSYSLYVWQTLFLVGRDIPKPFGHLQTFPLNIAATLACAVLSYYLVERPLLRVGHRLAVAAHSRPIDPMQIR